MTMIVILIFVTIAIPIGYFVFKTQREINEIREEKIDKAVKRFYKRNPSKAKREKRKNQLDKLLEE